MKVTLEQYNLIKKKIYKPIRIFSIHKSKNTPIVIIISKTEICNAKKLRSLINYFQCLYLSKVEQLLQYK